TEELFSVLNDGTSPLSKSNDGISPFSKSNDGISPFSKSNDGISPFSKSNGDIPPFSFPNPPPFCVPIASISIEDALINVEEFASCPSLVEGILPFNCPLMLCARRTQNSFKY